MLEVIVQTDKYWSPAGHQLTASQFMLVTSWPPCINRLAVSWGELVTDQLATSWPPAGHQLAPAGHQSIISWSLAGYQLFNICLLACHQPNVNLSPAGHQPGISRATAGHQPVMIILQVLLLLTSWRSQYRDFTTPSNTFLTIASVYISSGVSSFCLLKSCGNI